MLQPGLIPVAAQTSHLAITDDLKESEEEVSKPTASSVKDELDTLTVLSQERFVELLSRVKRLEAIMVCSAGTTIVLLLGIIVSQ